MKMISTLLRITDLLNLRNIVRKIKEKLGMLGVLFKFW